LEPVQSFTIHDTVNVAVVDELPFLHIGDILVRDLRSRTQNVRCVTSCKDTDTVSPFDGRKCNAQVAVRLSSCDEEQTVEHKGIDKAVELEQDLGWNDFWETPALSVMEGPVKLLIFIV
jgi:hypothetical protein